MYADNTGMYAYRMQLLVICLSNKECIVIIDVEKKQV